MSRMDLIERQRRLRKALDDGFRIEYSRHGEAQMLERNIIRSDVEQVIKRGTVVGFDMDPRHAGETWRVSGATLDGDQLTVVIALYEDRLVIRMVTAFEVGGPS